MWRRNRTHGIFPINIWWRWAFAIHMSCPEFALLLDVLLFWGPLCFPLTRQKVVFSGILIPARCLLVLGIQFALGNLVGFAPGCTGWFHFVLFYLAIGLLCETRWSYDGMW